MRRTLVIAVILALYFAIAFRVPYGLWDSYTMWGLKARLMVYHNPLWLFQAIPDIHNQYPPLLYLSLSTLYRIFGDMPIVPIVFHGALLGLLILPFRGWALLIVGLVGVEFAASQYADLPIALTFLGAAVAYQHRREDLAGAALGVGLLLKNEGLIIALAFSAVWMLRERRIPRTALTTVLGFVVALWVFHALFQFPNDMPAPGALSRLIDGRRWIVLLPLLITGIVTFGSGALPLTGALALLERKRVVVSVPLLAAGVVAALYVAIYAMTPHPIEWHVRTSWDRLLFQLFPVFVYAVFEYNRGYERTHIPSQSSRT